MAQRQKKPLNPLLVIIGIVVLFMVGLILYALVMNFTKKPVKNKPPPRMEIIKQSIDTNTTATPSQTNAKQEELIIVSSLQNTISPEQKPDSTDSSLSTYFSWIYWYF